MSLRDQELLKAVRAAASTYAQFPAGSRTSFDIVGAIAALDIPLLFRPLEGLWGATVGSEIGRRGILVTTKLDLHVQRFTLAHELGHIVLGHTSSFDRQVGFEGKHTRSARPIEEWAADTFASELLGHKSLMLASARRHGWNRQALMRPENIYQLSLRLGLSYKATCWALVTNKVLTVANARKLHELPVKDAKLAFAKPELISDPWADVWMITEKDSGTTLEGGPNDIFSLWLEEDSSAGFLWELVSPSPAGEVLSETITVREKVYGATAMRVVHLRFNAAGVHRLQFEHRRPWSNQIASHIDISIDNYGKEVGGHARRVREHALLAEVA